MSNQQQENLEDIIINSNKGSNFKKLLLVAAVLLLVLIIIILVTKSLIQPEEKQNTRVILPPEPIVEQAKKEEPLFEDIPIENENRDTKIDEVIGKIKKETIEVKNKEDSKPKYQKSLDTTKLKTVKQSSKDESRENIDEDVYYIQVGAFFSYPPDKKFLNTLNKEKLSYLIVKAEKNGKTYEKVMVGPYPSKEKAKEVLPIIRKRINQNAYITKK